MVNPMKYKTITIEAGEEAPRKVGPRLSKSRKKSLKKIKYIETSPFSYFSYRRKKGGKRGAVYIRGVCATLECRAFIKNSRLSPRQFDSRACRHHRTLPGFLR